MTWSAAEVTCWAQTEPDRYGAGLPWLAATLERNCIGKLFIFIIHPISDPSTSDRDSFANACLVIITLLFGFGKYRWQSVAPAWRERDVRKSQPD